MNEKDWNEIWDNEPDEDDDFNEIGSDVDANNDETFDNAAEWNEDEHEELIARDSILSHSSRNGSTSHNSNNNNHPKVSNHRTPQILRVDELERQLMETSITPQVQIPNIMHQPKRSGWSPFSGKELFTTPVSPTQTLFKERDFVFQGQIPPNLTLEQQQQILLQQQKLLQQQYLLSVLKQQQIQQEQRFMAQNAQCFTVEELERQMFQNQPSQQSSEPSREHQQQQNNMNDRNSNDESFKKSRNTDEFNTREREDLDKRNKFKKQDRDARESRNDRGQRNHINHRDNRDQRDSRDHREHRDNRDHREHRDYKDHRDNRDRRHQKRSNFIILPPQVQLSVINKAERFPNIRASHEPNEFLQDRMHNTLKYFKFRSHTAESKRTHDGVLTEHDRNWLTKIQEKIQADYDDKMDQDYYYIVYFNRSSMTDEAVRRPCGPGVLDRRFIPRERLLYNSSI